MRGAECKRQPEGERGKQGLGGPYRVGAGGGNVRAAHSFHSPKTWGDGRKETMPYMYLQSYVSVTCC